MEWLYGTLFFVYGLVFGSFFNVVGLRVPLKESIVRPPSHCPNCNTRLTALDLLPVVSYVFIGGTCRHCKTPISPIYPAMELATGALYLWAYVHFGWSMELVVALLFASLLVIITVSDFAYMLIPDRVLLPFGVVLAVLRFVVPLDPMWEAYVASALGFVLLLGVAILSEKLFQKEGMGGGDIKLYAVIGLVLGIGNTVLSIFVAAVIGIFAAVLAPRIRKGNGEMPFGPSIALAAWLCYLYGHYAIDWYLGFFAS